MKGFLGHRGGWLGIIVVFLIMTMMACGAITTEEDGALTGDGTATGDGTDAIALETGDGTIDVGEGILVASLTDAPVDEADAVNITIKSIMVHASDALAGESSSDEVEGDDTEEAEAEEVEEEEGEENTTSGGPAQAPQSDQGVQGQDGETYSGQTDTGSGQGDSASQGDGSDTEDANEGDGSDTEGAEEEEVEVEIEEETGEETGEEGDGDSGSEGSSWITISDIPLTVNLLELTNGNLAELGMVDLPAGKYTQIRLMIDTDENPPEIVIGEDTYPLTIPSGGETGIKINGEFDVIADEETNLILDFDLRKSIFLTGLANAKGGKLPEGIDENSKYFMRPTVRLSVLEESSNVVIEGLDENAKVYAFSKDESKGEDGFGGDPSELNPETPEEVDSSDMVNSAAPDEDPATLSFLPPGDYDVVIDTDGDGIPDETKEITIGEEDVTINLDEVEEEEEDIE